MTGNPVRDDDPQKLGAGMKAVSPARPPGLGTPAAHDRGQLPRAPGGLPRTPITCTDAVLPTGASAVISVSVVANDSGEVNDTARSRLTHLARPSRTTARRPDEPCGREASATRGLPPAGLLLKVCQHIASAIDDTRWQGLHLTEEYAGMFGRSPHHWSRRRRRDRSGLPGR